MKQFIYILLLVIVSGIIAGCRVRKVAKGTETVAENSTSTSLHNQTSIISESDTEQTEKVTVIYIRDTVKNIWIPAKKSETIQTSTARRQATENIVATDTVSGSKESVVHSQTVTEENKQPPFRMLLIGFAAGVISLLVLVFFIKR